MTGPLGGRRTRRAALRAALAAGTAASVVGLVDTVAGFGTGRRVRGLTATATTVAAGLGAALELPVLGPPVAGAVAVAAAVSRRVTWPRSVSRLIAGAGVGAVAAVATARWWPRIDPTPAAARPADPRYRSIEPAPTVPRCVSWSTPWPAPTVMATGSRPSATPFRRPPSS